MNSERKQILEAVLLNIKCISDRSYQERVWIRGEGPECDDFDETVCFFSPEVDGVINHYKDFGLTDEQNRRLSEFRNEFEAFCDGPALENSLPQQFIDTSEWQKVMKMAQELHEFLDLQEIEPRINLKPLRK